MAIGLVQSKLGGNFSFTGSSTFTAVTTGVGFNSNTTPGNLIVLSAWESNSAVSPNTCGIPNFGTSAFNTSGFAWTQVRAPFGYQDDVSFPVTAGQHGIFYIPNAPVMSTSVLTTFSVVQPISGGDVYTARLEFALYEFSGLKTVTPLERNVFAQRTAPSAATSTVNPGNITTTNLNDLVFVASIGKPGVTQTAGAGYTLGINATVATIGQVQYMMNVPAATYSTAFVGTLPYWGATAAAFIGATATAVAVSFNTQPILIGF